MRLNRFAKLLDYDAAIIMDKKNLKYFCGADVLGGGVFLIVFKDKSPLVLTNNLEKFSIGLRIKTVVYEKREDVEKLFKSLLKRCKTIGVEENVGYATLKKIRGWLPKKKWFDISSEISKLRVVKDGVELKNIIKATKIAESGLTKTLDKTKAGMTESQIWKELKKNLLDLGSETNFCIVQADSNSAKIHKPISDKRLKRVLLIDVGPTYKGYGTDITRCFFFKKQNKLEKTIYSSVLNAQMKTISKIREGMNASELYNIVKDEFGSRAKYFTHALGHGIGLDIHESPSLSEKSGDVLKKGMVFTVEPGLYLPGKFGIRIEDVVLVTKKGYKLISRFKK